MEDVGDTTGCTAGGVAGCVATTTVTLVSRSDLNVFGKGVASLVAACVMVGLYRIIVTVDIV